jgi:hypothetical protein
MAIVVGAPIINDPFTEPAQVHSPHQLESVLAAEPTPTS